MVRLMIDESGYTDDWLTQFGFSFDTASTFAGNSWCAYTPITGKKALTEGYYTEAYKRFQELGGTYLLETEGYDLIQEDGKSDWHSRTQYGGWHGICYPCGCGDSGDWRLCGQR